MNRSSQIRQAGKDGATPAQVVAALAERGVVVSRNLVRQVLKNERRRRKQAEPVNRSAEIRKLLATGMKAAAIREELAVRGIVVSLNLIDEVRKSDRRRILRKAKDEELQANEARSERWCGYAVTIASDVLHRFRNNKLWEEGDVVDHADPLPMFWDEHGVPDVVLCIWDAESEDDLPDREPELSQIVPRKFDDSGMLLAFEQKQEMWTLSYGCHYNANGRYYFTGDSWRSEHERMA